MHKSLALAFGLLLAAPASAQAASSSVATAQQLLPQEQQQTQGAQVTIGQIQQQARTVQQQVAQSQQQFAQVQKTLASPAQILAGAKPAGIATVAAAKAHAAVFNHTAVTLQTLTEQAAQQIQVMHQTASRIAVLAKHTHQQAAQTAAQTASVQTLLNGQLQFVEEHGSVGYLSVLFGARSFSDFISRVEMLSAVLGQTAQLQGQLHNQSRRQRREARQLAQEQTLMQQMQQTLVQYHAVLIQEKVLLQHAIHVAAGQVQSAQIQAAVAQYGQTPASRPALYHALYPLIAPLAKQDDVPSSLILAVITEESGGQTQTVSGAGAIGLMQLEPGTAQMLGMNPHALTNPQVNVVAGCLYLHDLLSEFHGHTSLALSAYNAGPGAVTANHDMVVPVTAGYVRNVKTMATQYAAMPVPGAS